MAWVKRVPDVSGVPRATVVGTPSSSEPMVPVRGP